MVRFPHLSSRDFLLSLFIVLSLPVFGAEEEPLNLRGILLGTDGTPSSGTIVYLIGVDRMNRVNFEEALHRPHYHDTTDAHGQFEFAFTPVRGSSASKTDPNGLPGYGAYYAVVPPSSAGTRAGAVSQRIMNNFQSDPPKQNETEPDRLFLGPSVTDLTLKIRAGVALGGRVFDTAMKPLAWIPLTLSFDLHATSHTGYGGEIFELLAVTDAQGAFAFQNVYPSTMTLKLNSDNHFRGGWIRTRLAGDGPWIEDRVDEVFAGEIRHVEMVFSPGRKFKVFGAVRDESGRPIAGATVTVGASFHREARTWSDTHHYLESQTDEHGNYEVFAETPWIRGMDAKKEGFQRQDIGDWQTAISPGRYDFILRPMPNETPIP